MCEITWVCNAETCFNTSSIIDVLSVLRHTPLSYLGIQQSIKLGDKFINNNYDEYYSSPCLSTIMTALLSLRKKNYKNPISIKLITNLCEDIYLPSFISDNNNIIKSQKLQILINYIKKWLSTKYFDNYIDYEFIEIINKLRSYNLVDIDIDLLNNLSKCTCNFNEQTKTDNLKDLIAQLKNKNNPRLDNIIKELSYFTDPRFFESCNVILQTDPYIYNNKDLKDFINLNSSRSKKIICFSHPDKLKSYYNLPRPMFNTDIIKHIIGNKNTDYNVSYINNNFKKISYVICSEICGASYGHNMFKIINYLLNEEYKNTQQHINELFIVDIEQLKTIRDIHNTTSVEDNFELVGSGYYKKYLKYKHKYLLLSQK